MLPMTQLSPEPWVREYVVGKHLLYTACDFEMLIACLRGNMKAMNGNWKLWKIRIEMVLNLSITHPCVHYHFKGFHTNWMNFSANTLYFPTQVVDLHAGPSNICRALSHRECHGNESKRGAHEFEAEGGAALQGRWRLLEKRKEIRIQVAFQRIGDFRYEVYRIKSQ